MAQARESWGHGQPCSSVPSPQSSCPSQSRTRGRQRPELQDTCPSPQPRVAQPGAERAGRLRTPTEAPREAPTPETGVEPCPQGAGNWTRSLGSGPRTRAFIGGLTDHLSLPHATQDTHPPRLSHRHSHPGCHRATRGAHSARFPGMGSLPPHSQARAPHSGRRRPHKATDFPDTCCGQGIRVSVAALGLASPGHGGTPHAPLTSCHSPSAAPCPAGRSCPPTRTGRQPAPSRCLLRAQTAGLQPKRHAVTTALWPLRTPLPRAPSPLPTLTLHTVEQSPLGAETALHTGDGPAGPPRLGTVVLARGRARGATGLIHLAPLTLQSWVGRREAWVTAGQGPQEATAVGEPAQSEAWRAPGCMDGVDVLLGTCQGYLRQSSDLSMFGSPRTVSGS